MTQVLILVTPTGSPVPLPYATHTSAGNGVRVESIDADNCVTVRSDFDGRRMRVPPALIPPLLGLRLISEQAFSARNS